MPIIQSEIMICGNYQSLYNFTQDYNKRLQWDPFLKEAKLMGEINAVKIGARAWCVSKMGIGMETEYVFVQEPIVVAVKMTKGPLILKNFAGSWRFIEIDESITKVIFRYHFSSRFKVIDPVIHYFLHREMKKRLLYMKRKFETMS